MRLSNFIVQYMEPILEQWDAFAATLLPAASGLDRAALRDHGEQILEAVAKDLSAPQSAVAQREKSIGKAPVLADAPETAAHAHAVLRARGGFDVNQLVAEYRALRASVLRLWFDLCLPESPHQDDVVRFNEAIDQAVAESVSAFSAQVEQARNLLLGMLGHDMRSPLQTIQMTARYLTALNAGEEVTDAAARLIRSGARVQSLLDDLCDLGRTRLGLGISIFRTDADLASVFSEAVELLRAAHPDRTIELDIRGELQGSWDVNRLQQLLDNLVVNALKYGSQDAPVCIRVVSREEQVRVEVANTGDVIDPVTLQEIFDPLRRGPAQRSGKDRGDGLGLGLYIAGEIAKAHQGLVQALSSTTETVFIVTLPRRV
jgi:signal transduction histidine kinase